ncbi:peptidoglycan DD-metalloendopeptidase family protein [Euzebya sp.]|uniref:peptidoglycan DD-metalloendopeptidase family protein n=1 Tax=Euzebya sp. TaxID=1971409 RepID=UPI0035173F1C
MRRALAAVVVVVLAPPLGLMMSTSTGTAGWPAGFDPAPLTGEIPEPMLSAYLDAAETWEVDWALLAAVGKLECDHGRYRAPGCWPPGTINQAGARGPMQFLGSTWRSSAGRYDLDVAGPPARDGQGYGTDGDDDGIADPWSPLDAVHSAARYLVALGGRDDPRRAAKSYNAGPANTNPTAGESYATRALELIAHYHRLAGAGGPGTPTVAVVQDGYALPFDPAGLHAVTSEASPPRDPEWQLVRPHHSGRVGIDIAMPVGTTLYALVDAEVVWASDSGNCGYGLAIRNADQHASITYCHLSAINVSAGQQVAAGQPLGRSGGQPGTAGAGNSTGPHLHLHIDTPAGRRCPQALLLGLWRGWPVPTIAALRTSGCTYTSVAPPPQSPVPVPPDLPIP